MKFSDIYGHESVKQRLRMMADSSRLPNALLLEGPAGTSKFMLARAFAQYIHCTGDKSSGNPCGRCVSCQQHESFNHPDTFFSFPIVKKSDYPISDEFLKKWREFLAESPLMDKEIWLQKLDNINAQPKIYVAEGIELMRKLNLTATSSKYRIVLMWQPEKMMAECANKMLKLVEEPFPDTMFIMVSDDSRQILPTIYSRTQRIELKRYSEKEVTDYLTDRCAIGTDAAVSAANLSEGSLLKALRVVDTAQETDEYFNLFKDLMRKAYQRRVAELKSWANTCAGLGRERLIQFLTFCTRMMRENFMMNIRVPGLMSMTVDEEAFGRNFSRFVNERNVAGMIKLFDEAIADIAANANGKIVMFDVAMKICILIKK